MNKKLKEFAVQSDLWRMLDEYSWEFGSCDPEKDCGRIEKFAELIVKECANRASWAQDTGEKDIGGEVLKHFGVEE
jgi:hypothetical protein